MCPERLDLEDVADLAECLVRWDVRYLARHPETPALYAAGLDYLKEPDRGGVEWWWLTPGHILRLGYCDCKALVCWRVAEMRRAGDRGALAVPVLMDAQKGTIHLVAVAGDGELDDPSQRLLLARGAAA